MYIAHVTDAEEGTIHEVPRDARFVANSAGATLLSNWVAANSGHTAVVDAQSDPIDIAIAPHVAAWIDTSDNSIGYSYNPTRSAQETGDMRKNILRPRGLALWRSLPTPDLSKQGEGLARARKATLYVVQLCLLGADTTILGDNAKWAEIEPLFNLNMGKFQRAILIQTTNVGDGPQETGGWTDTKLQDRNIYKPAATVVGATANTVDATQITALNNSLPANWSSDANYGPNIDSVIDYLYSQ